ncbi:methyltransferase-like protein 16 isoform X1 [Panicum miliaceum]|uniref:U6 small nuclear RNA (adenine-(43)-N(6))-methyltransferase n=1 Tax=Panicum miliaceum TaxID=4540 RepID=A0A3L6QBA3_PANMI|nr:methyltransferase-like protein 16 isoform X1 [Panicum miliaceum]
MGGGRKRRRDGSEAPSIHPRNRYAAAAPDFAALAELYPSFRPFVSVSERGRASVDFTDFSATRELTRVLLLHDHGVNWWIPDGQLCPTVPNRSNYIHWIEDLLSSILIPPISSSSGRVRGFDIGTGANCIYPLLGASLLGWSFVGSDVTDVALEWAKKNAENNPHLTELIEIRNANAASLSSESEAIVREPIRENVLEPAEDVAMPKPPVLVGVLKESESFDFCMCNPPFFWLQLGLRREHGAFQVLKSTEAFFLASKLSCKIDTLSFSVDVTLSDEQTEAAILHGDDYGGSLKESSAKLQSVVKGVSFRITVFEQIPGTLLIKGSLLNKALSGTFSSLFSQLEDTLRMECPSKAR